MKALGCFDANCCKLGHSILDTYNQVFKDGSEELNFIFLELATAPALSNLLSILVLASMEALLRTNS